MRKFSYTGLMKMAQSFSDDGKTFTLSPGQNIGMVVSSWNKAHPESQITARQVMDANGGLEATKYRADKPYAMPEPGISFPTEGPLGYRQHNPGNLRSDGKTSWHGAVSVPKAGKFLTFKSYRDGIRAMARTLFNYGSRHGIDTVEGAVARFAPSSENETAKYQSEVLSKLGLEPGSKVDLTSEDFLQKIVPIMATKEIGPRYYGRYDPSIVSNGVHLAVPGRSGK